MNRHWDIQPDFSIEVTPRLSNLVLIRKIVNSLTADLGVSEEHALQLEMAVDEACSNSIVSIREKEGETSITRVRIEISVQEHCLRLAIVDSGNNFREQYERALPFHEGTDRTRDRGYGLQIIKTFMDEVDYIHDPAFGNKLILTKYLRSN